MDKILYWILLMAISFTMTGCAFTQEAQIKRNGELTQKWDKKIQTWIPEGTSKEGAIEILRHHHFYFDSTPEIFATKNFGFGHRIKIYIGVDSAQRTSKPLVVVDKSSSL